MIWQSLVRWNQSNFSLLLDRYLKSLIRKCFGWKYNRSWGRGCVLKSTFTYVSASFITQNHKGYIVKCWCIKNDWLLVKTHDEDVSLNTIYIYIHITGQKSSRSRFHTLQEQTFWVKGIAESIHCGGKLPKAKMRAFAGLLKDPCRDEMVLWVVVSSLFFSFSPLFAGYSKVTNTTTYISVKWSNQTWVKG